MPLKNGVFNHIRVIKVFLFITKAIVFHLHSASLKCLKYSWKDYKNKKKGWALSIRSVEPTARIYTFVTNSSQSLMESIRPCKYLQDKKALRQSIPIYRTMESFSAAVFQVRKINRVSFGKKNRGEGNNFAVAPLNLSLKCSPSFHHPDLCVDSSFSKVQV